MSRPPLLEGLPSQRHDEPEVISWPRAFRAALSVDFEHIHDASDGDQVRVGIACLVIGAVLVVPGVILGVILTRFFGRAFDVFFLVAGIGGIILAIGLYRLGVRFFPFLKRDTKAASLARMAYILVCLSALGAAALYFAWSRGWVG